MRQGELTVQGAPVISVPVQVEPAEQAGAAAVVVVVEGVGPELFGWEEVRFVCPLGAGWVLVAGAKDVLVDAGAGVGLSSLVPDGTIDPFGIWDSEVRLVSVSFGAT